MKLLASGLIAALSQGLCALAAQNVAADHQLPGGYIFQFDNANVRLRQTLLLGSGMDRSMQLC